MTTTRELCSIVKDNTTVVKDNATVFLSGYQDKGNPRKKNKRLYRTPVLDRNESRRRKKAFYRTNVELGSDEEGTPSPRVLALKWNREEKNGKCWADGEENEEPSFFVRYQYHHKKVNG